PSRVALIPPAPTPAPLVATEMGEAVSAMLPPSSAPTPAAATPTHIQKQVLAAISSPSAQQMAKPPKWPRDIPSHEGAARLLSDGADRTSWAAITQKWLEQLSELEKAGLFRQPAPFDLTLLHPALVSRWRLFAAVETKPTQE